MIENMPHEAEVLKRLTDWGKAHSAIRAMIMTSTRARTDGPRDFLSDYDIVLVVPDAAAFVQDEGWYLAYGPSLSRWGNENEYFAHRTYFQGVVYEDYIKIDWGVWPTAIAEHVGTEGRLIDELDVGYRVLLDKDGLTANWPAPTYRAHIPAKPSAAEYRALVEEFWWTSTYVAKSLWRGEVMFTKFCLDYDIKLQALRRMLEWRIQLDRDWSWKPGVLARGLNHALPPELWAELAATYIGAGIEENWEAFFHTAEIFRRVAVEVGEALGYSYPRRIDELTTAYLREIRQLPPGLAMR